MRPAHNRKPATYRCPLCGEYLPALSEHVLIAPEGDWRRRRHAHQRCVIEARGRGHLPTQNEWQQQQPGPIPRWRQALAWLRGRRPG